MTKDSFIFIQLRLISVPNSDVSGICFTKNPVTGRNEVIIEAAYGLGEYIVGGEVTPDRYVVKKDVIKKNHIVQHKKLQLTSKGPVNEIIFDWSDKLSDKQIREVEQVSLQLAEHMGYPADIEWAYENNVLHIVQIRPITT